jgi:hypothetical protein
MMGPRMMRRVAEMRINHCFSESPLLFHLLPQPTFPSDLTQLRVINTRRNDDCTYGLVQFPVDNQYVILI